MQPTFLPWIGYFDMMDQVDHFILYDDVQLAKRSWQIRNRIKTAQGELFLTVPVKKTKNRDELLISEAEISYEENWQSKHLKSIEIAYCKAPYFSEVFHFISGLYSAKEGFLGDFNSQFIISVSEKIGIECNILRASLLFKISGAKDQRLASICKEIKSDTYLSPQGSAVYIESIIPGGEIVKAGIDLYYHFYDHPKYQQLNGDFLPYMSMIDLLFNVGFENALFVVRSGRKNKVHYRDFRQTIFQNNILPNEN